MTSPCATAAARPARIAGLPVQTKRQPEAPTMRCDRCGAIPERYPAQAHDLCAECLTDLCEPCMAEGCCSHRPALSDNAVGTEAHARHVARRAGSPVTK